MATKLYYFHDPMCSWCWGFKPTWQQLKAVLPEQVEVVNILGGLAPDSDAPMPEDLQQTLQSVWQRIHQQLGTEFNFDFWQQCQPRRSTYPACRAVIAASVQGAEEAMITAIQQGYYLEAQNPSDLDTLVGFARGLSLDVELFEEHMASEELDSLLQQEIDFYQQMPVKGFPSLALVHKDVVYPISIDYLNPTPILTQIEIICAS